MMKLIVCVFLCFFSLCCETHKEAQDALKSLHKMQGATQIGLNVQAYASRTTDLKADIDEKLAEMPDGELKREIQLALQAYVDAAVLWNHIHSNYTTDEYFYPALSPQIKSLVEKYMPIKGFMERDAVITVIWKTADQHIERATQLLNE